MKLVGIALMSAGSVLCWWKSVVARRSRIQALWQLTAALERMENAVRWQMLPLPRVLEREATDTTWGKCFSEIKDSLKSEIPLHMLWSRTFSKIQPEEAAQIVCRIDLQGDVTQLTGSLHLAAEELRRLARQLEATRQEKERLTAAAGAAVAAMLITVLI